MRIRKKNKRGVRNYGLDVAIFREVVELEQSRAEVARRWGVSVQFVNAVIKRMTTPNKEGVYA